MVLGYARDAATGKPIPFPRITIEGRKSEYMGDMEGNFTIPVAPGQKGIVIHAYQYLEAELSYQGEDTLRGLLYFAHPFTFQTITTGPAKGLVRRLLRQRSTMDPRKERKYQYQSYNKLVITTAYVSALKVYLDNMIRFFSPVRMGSLATDHHIFLMESASERKFYDPYRQKETILASRVSGINKPPPLSLISGFEPLSVYEPFLRIGGRKYVSPLAGRPGKRYVYFVTDSIRLDSQMVYLVKFNPKSLRNKELLQGFFYVATKPFGVMAFQAWPAFDRESTFSLMQQCRPLPSGRWFPTEIKTTYQRNRLGSLKIPIVASSKTYIFDQGTISQPDTQKYSEVIFEFQKEKLLFGKDFPARLRQESLSNRDKNTYTYFEKIGSLKAIDRYLTFGQKLVAGKIPFGKVDMVFRNAVTVNDQEGLRIGFGLQTNESLSRIHQGGGYFAKGLKDQQWKFGLNYQFHLTPKDVLTAQWKKDLAEPGIFSFSFNKQQYSTEQLRTIRISRFDKVNALELGWNHQWAPTVISRVSAEMGRRQYLYYYRYAADSASEGFDIAELGVDVHWAPGEQFARYAQDKFSLGSPYPSFWLQYAQGFGPVSRDAWTYSRFEGKIQWTRRILGLGELGLQVVAGYQTGRRPYPLLFSSRASYRDFSLLSYNSFETMRYNEFVHDRFVSIFFSHKFSKMQISNLPYRPYFTLVHNMGWGSVRNPEKHLGIIIKDSPKGYLESGLFLNDIFVIPLSGLSLGIGAGMFVRYGHYALDGYLNNLAFKFSTSLGF
jgi:hypothetical protein